MHAALDIFSAQRADDVVLWSAPVSEMLFLGNRNHKQQVCTVVLDKPSCVRVSVCMCVWFTIHWKNLLKKKSLFFLELNDKKNLRLS